MAKKVTPPKTYDFGFVRWDDAKASSAELISADNIKEQHAPAVVITVGWIVESDEAGISVCGEYIEGLGYRGHTFIPRALITGVLIVRKAYKKGETKLASPLNPAPIEVKQP